MLLSDLVDTSARVAGTSARNGKVALIADLLRRCDPQEAAAVAAYLSGTLPQRRVGVGWRGLSDLPAPAPQPGLTIEDTDLALDRLAAAGGAGSHASRREALGDLFGRATGPEQEFLRGLILGGVRQGALDGVMLSAIAQAAQVPDGAVRRAVMLTGFVGPVAQAALSGGAGALAAITLEVGRPVRPMLAGSAPDVPSALPDPGRPMVVERKIDGIRIQAHKRGDEVRLFTRSLEEITERLPEVVDVVRAVAAGTAILDGETVALGPDGRPRPFQVTGSRTASSSDPDLLRATTPLTTTFFDLLHLDGADLLAEPLAERITRLAPVLPAGAGITRLTTESVSAAQAFFDAQVAAGHEGVIVKDPASPYAAGRRGAGWVKVKPRHTLDLVVLAVEWGSGRRRGTLSNIHLGARGADGGFVMLGKTFKGMTDAMLAWQTERFLDLETRRDGHTVHVRPEQVVEIAFDGIQRSSRYPGGMALRFARVLRYRDDKSAAEADTIETVARLRGW